VHPVFVILFVLPILAAAILLLVRRARSLCALIPALVLSGITTALTTAFFAFTSGSVPMAPHESADGACLPIVGQVLLAVYVGFGIGVIIAALIGPPYQLLARRRRA